MVTTAMPTPSFLVHPAGALCHGSRPTRGWRRRWRFRLIPGTRFAQPTCAYACTMGWRRDRIRVVRRHASAEGSLSRVAKPAPIGGCPSPRRPPGVPVPCPGGCATSRRGCRRVRVASALSGGLPASATRAHSAVDAHCAQHASPRCGAPARVSGARPIGGPVVPLVCSLLCMRHRLVCARPVDARWSSTGGESSADSTGGIDFHGRYGRSRIDSSAPPQRCPSSATATVGPSDSASVCASASATQSRSPAEQAAAVDQRPRHRGSRRPRRRGRS